MKFSAAAFRIRQFSTALLFFAVSAAAVPLMAVNCAAQSNPSMIFTWDASSGTGLAGYYLYWRTPAGSYNTTNRIQIANPAATSTTITSLAEGTYYFQATAYNSSQVESSPSNEVTFYVIKPTLEVGTVAGRSFSVQITANGNSTILLDSTVTAVTGGSVRLPSNTSLPASLSVKVKSPGYLRKQFNARAISDTTSYAALLAGDLDNSNSVNSVDWNVISGDYFLSGRTSDFNNDNVTNSADLYYVSKNYFVSGD